ncbi:hypothetical protein KKC59_04615, partial [bacterium]|nr:hypothetical protein [bacterium]
MKFCIVLFYVLVMNSSVFALEAGNNLACESMLKKQVNRDVFESIFSDNTINLQSKKEKIEKIIGYSDE